MDTSERSPVIDLAVEGMTCGACVNRVQTALQKVPGVVSASVNLASRRARVAGTAPLTSLVSAVEAAGYRGEAAPTDAAGEAAAETADKRVARATFRRFVVAAAFTAPLLLPMAAALLGFPHLFFGWAQALLAAPVQFWAGAPFYRAAWKALRARTGNMDLLVALGTTAAYGFSLFQLTAQSPHLYFESSSVVVTLVLLGRWLEARARRRAASSLRALTTLRPEMALVERDGGTSQIPADLVAPGDILVIKPGSRFAADGIVVEGESEADESLLTGESRPVEKLPGKRVIGGSLNGDGLLKIRASAAASEGQLARIIALVENAQASKAPVERLVDRISAIFVPAVLVLSLAVFAGWALAGDWQAGLINAVAVLVVACPCALGLATPTAIIVGTGLAARRGILLRDASALERAKDISTVVFDKTGTLTNGLLQVLSIDVPKDGEAERKRVLQLAASLQQGSEHPLARGMMLLAARDSIAFLPLSEFRRLGGRGVTGKIGGEPAALGNARLMAELSVLIEPVLPASGSAVYLAAGTPLKAIATFTVGDCLRDTAPAAIASLKARGIETVMLTGDGDTAARAAADRLGVDRVIANVSPEGKVAEIVRLRAEGRVLAMVGDGVNDAPALAAADVGIAMAGGSDAAKASAAVTLMRGDPRLVAEAIDLSRRTSRKIRENLFWAFVYNLVMLPLAAAGDLSPMLAGAAMALSSVSVVGNSLLLRRRRESEQ